MDSAVTAVASSDVPPRVLCRAGLANWLAAGLLAGCGLAIDGQLLSQPFLTWDDELHITANPAFNPLRWSRVVEFWRQPYENLYIPISYTIFALETAATDWLFPRAVGTPLRSAVLFRMTSLVLHWLCSLGVWRLLQRFAVRESAALCGAVLFAVHPLQVESVAWISETRGLLASLACLAALECHWCWREGSDRRWQVASLVALMLGLLAKPSAAAMVPMALVIDIGWLKRPWINAMVGNAPAMVIVAGIAWLSRLLQPTAANLSVVPLWWRSVVALDAIGWYALHLVWPHPLAMDYGRSPSELWNTWDWPWLTSVPVAIAALFWWLRAPRGVWVAAGLFIGGLLPVCGLIPFAYQAISTVADRYAYLAMMGAALGVALMSNAITQRWQWGAVAGVAGLLGVLSFQTAANWRDNETLYTHALQVNPASWIARHNRALLWLEGGDAAAAERELRRALDIRPNNPQAWVTLGRCLRELKRPEESLEAFRQAVLVSPEDERFRLNLANVLAAQQRREEAFEHIQAALDIRPDDPDVLSDAAAVLRQIGRVSEAVALYEHALRLDPGLWTARFHLGLTFDEQQRWADAARHYSAVLAQLPHLSEVRFRLALDMARQQLYATALRELERVHRDAAAQQDLQLRNAAAKELAVLHNQIGVEYLDQGNWTAAAEKFQAAVTVEPNFAAGHFNLGRARASGGEFARARAAFEQALSLLPPGSPEAKDVSDAVSRLPRDASPVHHDSENAP